jgi:hypothetical protein
MMQTDPTLAKIAAQFTKFDIKPSKRAPPKGGAPSLPDLVRYASQNHASTEARMPAVAGAANDRSWGNDNWRSRRNDNWRARDDDDRTIRTTPSELVAMKARPTAALGSGAIDGNE